MNSLYVYSHLGLGDLILASGYVRYFTEEYDRVFVFCKPKNVKNLLSLYKDNPKIKILALDDQGVREFININPKNNFKIIGFSDFSKIFYRPDNKLHIDEIFYNLAGVPHSYKWEKFKYVREIEKEKQLFDSYNIKEPYIFVHDDNERRITKLPSKRIIRSNSNYSIFDHIMLMEHADELHLLPSSFFCLSDCLQFKNIFIHLYPMKERFSPLLISKTKYSVSII